MISLEQAQEKAELLAKGCLQNLVRKHPARWLREEFLTAENCWLFLKSNDIEFLDGCAESGDMAFVISTKGTAMSVADHQDNQDALREYLIKVSDYLKRRGE